MKKIYYMGRDITGKFSRETFINKITRKIQVMWYWTKVTFGIGFAGAIIGGGLVGAFFTSQTFGYARAEEPIIIDTMPAKIEALKDELIEDLRKCESPRNTQETQPVIYDNNEDGTIPKPEIASVGGLRFKQGTVIGYHKMRTGEVLSPTQAIVFALDYPKAADLAKYIIFNTPDTDKGIRNWYHCNKKLGLQARVDLIKKLTK